LLSLTFYKPHYTGSLNWRGGKYSRLVFVTYSLRILARPRNCPTEILGIIP
jgi:hypothetical protein